MITGIRGLCNGIGPALFGLIFYVFHVDLEDEVDRNLNFPLPTNHTNMEDPYGKVWCELPFRALAWFSLATQGQALAQEVLI